LLKNTAFLLLWGLVSCQQKPSLSPDAMKRILVDATLLEAGQQQQYNFGVLPDSAWLRDYRFVLAKHGLDTAEFYPALRWYKAHPDEYAQVWEGVITELQNLELERREQHP
jgi:hypothetical protein